MAKRKPLVCQHLENTSRDALKQYQHIVRRYVRHRQDVQPSISPLVLRHSEMDDNFTIMNLLNLQPHRLYHLSK